MCYDDEVGRVGVEPTCRLFDMRPVALCDAHTRIYRRQPILVALAECHSPVRETGLSSQTVRELMIYSNWGVEQAGIEPANCVGFLYLTSRQNVCNHHRLPIDSKGLVCFYIRLMSYLALSI